MRLAALILALTCLASCHSRTAPPAMPDAGEQNEARIMFLAYEVLRDSASGRLTTNILYQKLTSGEAKKGSLNQDSQALDNWLITVTDASNKALDSITVENPIHRFVEHVKEDGNQGMAELWLPRGELAFRMNYQTSMKKIIIRDKKSGTNIFSHPLNFQ